MVVKESWLDPNQSELENTKIINVKKKKSERRKIYGAKDKGPTTTIHTTRAKRVSQTPCNSASSNRKKKDQTGTLSTNNPSFFCTLWVLNDDGVKEREIKRDKVSSFGYRREEERRREKIQRNKIVSFFSSLHFPFYPVVFDAFVKS